MVSTSELIRLRQGRRVITASPTPRSPPLRNPTDVHINVQLERSVVHLNESFRPTNTMKAHGPKIDEFFEFCDSIYGHDPYKYNLSFEKVYRFMFFQSFRELKKRGGPRKQRKKKSTRTSDVDDVSVDAEEEDDGEEASPVIRFDREAYDAVMSGFSGVPGQGLLLPPSPSKPMSWSSFDQYKQVIKRIYRVQKQENVNSLDWDAIWQHPLDDLTKQVKARVPHVRKSTFQEKVTGDFAPYTIVERYAEIEQAFWDDSARAVGPRQLATQLRHRYCSQHTATGILRCESLYRAEFSDFLMVRAPKTETDIHPVDIMVNQIALGKTNHGRLLYGRAIRHKDVRLCCIGALSFYLQYRFYVTDEFANMGLDDWFENSTWFDIKLLSDVYSDDHSKEMTNDSYAKHVRKVLARLGLPSNKLLHLGRNIGARILDLLNEEDEAIRKMGQWNPSMYDTSYSSKLPMGPMRKLAGFHSNNPMYYNTRVDVKTPEVLERNTPIGKWVYDVYDAACADPKSSDHPTCMYVLKFFIELNRVFLQDTAAMLVLHPERQHHPLFRELPLFASDEYIVSL
jgi:Centromere DNA-binding protein complex CBF3 subunit, domain 2